MIYYRDFVTKKKRFTNGRFVGWQRGGPLRVWYAIVQRQKSTLLIPEYLIRADSLAQLPRIGRKTEGGQR